MTTHDVLTLILLGLGIQGACFATALVVALTVRD